MKPEIKSGGELDELECKLCDKSNGTPYSRKFFDTEDFELIKGLGIASLISAIFVIGSIAAMSFTFFYGSPEIVIWSVLLLLLKIRVCNGGIDISLHGILQKYFKIDITFTR